MLAKVSINQGKSTNSAALCQIGPQNNILQTKYWNLGPTIEVADAEIIGIYKALLAVRTYSQQHIISDVYIFSDSQAAIRKLLGYSQHTLAARKTMKYLVKQHI